METYFITSFLTESDYVSQIKTIIQVTQDGYRNDDSVNPFLLCRGVRGKSLSYSKTRKKQTKKQEEKREQTIARLEEELDKGNLNETENSQLESEIKAQKH